MNKYEVELQRTYVHSRRIMVTAESEDDAVKIGEAQIGDIVLPARTLVEGADNVTARLMFTPADPLPGTKINEEYIEKISAAIVRNDGYCPCRQVRTPDTKCPCKEYRLERKCECNLYTGDE